MRRLSIIAGILLLGASAGHGAIPEANLDTFGGAETIEVTLGNFDFTPPLLHLRAGRAYRLEIVNAASGSHDLRAPEFFAAARMPLGEAPAVAKGKVELVGGETKVIRLIPAAGRYKVTCSHLGHAVLGMKGEIVVD